MGTAVHAGWREASPRGSVIIAGRFLWVDVGAACYALLSPPLPGRSGRVRCTVLLGRRGALRFRGLLAFLAWPGTWATNSKILSLGSPAWDVVVSPFTDVFAGFRLRVLVVGAGELASLDWGAPALGFLRGLRAITKVDSNVCSLEPPVCAAVLAACRLAVAFLFCCRFFAAHDGHLIWPGIAGWKQSVHLPSSFALCRRFLWESRADCLGSGR